MNNVHFFLRQILRYSSDEKFLLILVIYDRWIPSAKNNVLNIILAKYKIVFCNVRYGTVRLMYSYMVRANACIPHVMRIVAFTRFYFLLQFSLACTIACCWPRSSAAARIPRLSTTAAPTLLATALLAPTIPLIFLFTSGLKFSM
jgi:hypothetical protein